MFNQVSITICLCLAFLKKNNVEFRCDLNLILSTYLKNYVLKMRELLSIIHVKHLHKHVCTFNIRKSVSNDLKRPDNLICQTHIHTFSISNFGLPKLAKSYLGNLRLNLHMFRFNKHELSRFVVSFKETVHILRNTQTGKKQLKFSGSSNFNTLIVSHITFGPGKADSLVRILILKLQLCFYFMKFKNFGAYFSIHYNYYNDLFVILNSLFQIFQVHNLKIFFCV